MSELAEDDGGTGADRRHWTRGADLQRLGHFAIRNLQHRSSGKSAIGVEVVQLDQLLPVHAEARHDHRQRVTGVHLVFLDTLRSVLLVAAGSAEAWDGTLAISFFDFVIIA